MRIGSLLLLSVFAFSCAGPKPELAAGVWRGVIQVQGQELPFNFEVEQSSNKTNVWLRNGDERLLLDDVTINGDSVNMVLHIFDAELRARVQDGVLSGYFIRNYAKEYRFPFSAKYGDQFRFKDGASATVDFSGTYDVWFFSERDTTQSVGVFKQKDNHVTGTFLLNSGDYRFLEGSVVADTMKLSTFDGNHAYVFIAVKKNDELIGDFYAGQATHERWKGVHNEKAKMPDAESLTLLKPGYDKITFSFPDENHKLISSTDDRFKNKVVILQIMGSWCPNCMDETRFLVPWYEKNKDRGIEILGLAYERKDDFEYASRRVKIMKEKMNIPYDVVIAGTNDKAKASETLPAINRIIGFPTTIIIGRDGKVKRIHTGFSGPGTGKYYEEFIGRFNEIINDLVNDKVNSVAP